jgi:hypothetical protein
MNPEYTLLLKKGAQDFFLRVKACDTAHAQAQASDICRALGAEEFQLTYGNKHKEKLSKLFEDLAFNNFSYNSCCMWEGSFTNNVPCIYIFGKRIYVRDLIVKYLDVPKDKHNPKPSCKCKSCINPYHFEYRLYKNEKLSCGDNMLLLAYRSQGASVSQIAKALNVHRSTIYRKLKNECFSSRSKDHSLRTRG